MIILKTQNDRNLTILQVKWEIRQYFMIQCQCVQDGYIQVPKPYPIHSCKLYCNYGLLIKILPQYDLSSEVVGKQRNLGAKCLVLVLTHSTTSGFKSTTRKRFKITWVSRYSILSQLTQLQSCQGNKHMRNVQNNKQKQKWI